ncbi:MULTISPECIES: hypothetical protein [Halococcus]|uniref:Uncharacterized protein n=1 Tax=Halococcus salifodinae DSM 8989 TaxID=1227456 RepID=M0NB54_9EURY|nr:MULTISPECIES: hypothetical protein [Halococcus]EMA55076.1 hypothetical protein C450_03377 [Halococcus salifodinae DSM 8989]
MTTLPTILMSDTMTIASLLSGVSIVMLLALTAVWLNNYRTFRTPLVLGLVAFGAVLLVENGVSLYYFFTMRSLYAMDPGVQQVIAAMRAFQAVALVFLTYVTMK